MKFLWDYLSLKQFFIRLAIGYWLVIDWLNGYRKISLNANVMNLMQTRDFSFLVIVYEYVFVCLYVPNSHYIIDDNNDDDDAMNAMCKTNFQKNPMV